MSKDWMNFIKKSEKPDLEPINADTVQETPEEENQPRPEKPRFKLSFPKVKRKEPTEEVLPEPVKKVKPVCYRPSELNDDEIIDIGNQLADRIIMFIDEHHMDPVPGDTPVNIMRAASLCTIAATQQNVGHIIMKQIEADHADQTPWWVAKMSWMILCGACLTVPAILIMLYEMLTKH